MIKIVRARAPLRLGFAGGGTDLSPYSDIYGGCILNATISMYAHCTIELTTNNKVIFDAKDIKEYWCGSLGEVDTCNNSLVLHKEIYKRVINEFNNGDELPVKVTTFSDAPPGSGLGSSSTMTVAILAAYTELLQHPLGEYELAHLAYEIERVDCDLAGGKQDQYAATFGGFNYMEFHKDDHVIVNPLRIKEEILHELESHMFMYYTGKSRESANIIKEQSKAAIVPKSIALDAMHKVKLSANQMKEALLRLDIERISEIINDAWKSKKETATSITNKEIDDIYDVVMSNGALASRISGAGGGGFMLIFTKPEDRISVISSLKKFNGYFYPVNFQNNGVVSWIVR